MDFIINNWWLLLIILATVLIIFKIFSVFKKPNNNIQKFIEDGAIIIDVRSESEFKSGYVKNSINVPLKDLMYRVNEFDKEKKYVTVCAAGIRAESAKKFFERKGFQVLNGGRWTTIKDLKNK